MAAIVGQRNANEQANPLTFTKSDERAHSYG